MIVDTSALIAVFKAEEGYEKVVRVLASSTPKSMSAGSLIETLTVVIRRFGSQHVGRVLAIVDEARIDVLPVEQRDAHFSAAAYARYGKGMGHPAQLNFGDTFAYALAKRTGEPLLCVGEDFPQTDLSLVPLP